MSHRFALLLSVLLFISHAVLAETPDVATLIQEGKEALAQDKFKDAQQKFSRAIQVDGKNVEAFHGSGLASLGLKQYAEAVSLLEKAAKFSPHPDRVIQINLTIARVHAGKLREAAEACKVSLDSSNAVDLRGYETYQSALFAAYLDEPDDLDTLRTFLTTYTHKVDELKKNEKRWGETWEDPAFVEKRRAALAKNYRQMEDARVDIQKAQATIEALENAVDNTESRGRHTGALGDRKQKLAHARAQLEKSRARYQSARSEFEASLPPLPHALDPLSMDAPPTTDNPTSDRSGKKH